MGCLLLFLMLAFPRVVMVLLFLFTNYLESAYHGVIVPLLGFIFLPLTTLAYAWMLHGRYPLDGPYLLILILTVLVDLGMIGGGEYHRRRW